LVFPSGAKWIAAPLSGGFCIADSLQEHGLFYRRGPSVQEKIMDASGKINLGLWFKKMVDAGNL
tara:strand:+ start:377 stop:568 length:192 start_codon:yes stop_codon:yes gene_type:complete